MFTTPIVPRVSETDGAGHINNTVVPVWLEAGRLGIFRILVPDLAFSRWRMILANTNVDFVAQLYFQHPAEVRTWVDRIGTRSFRLYEEVWQRDTLCAKGTATYVYFDYEAQRTEPVPEDVAARLREHLREPAPES